MAKTLTMPMIETKHPPAKQPPQMTVKRKKMPTGIASNVKQHVVLACDRSGSMSGHKIRELNTARETLISELALEANKDGFLVSNIDFHHEAVITVQGQSAVGLQIPHSQADGGTNFSAALSECQRAIQTVLNSGNRQGWHYLRPMVLFLSDGQAGVDDALVARLHQDAEVMAIAYGSDANKSKLSRIASDGNCLTVGTNGAQLRSFLASVGKTLSEGIQKAA